MLQARCNLLNCYLAMQCLGMEIETEEKCFCNELLTTLQQATVIAFDNGDYQRHSQNHHNPWNLSMYLKLLKLACTRMDT
jgi:hypothetical protein